MLFFLQAATLAVGCGGEEPPDETAPPGTTLRLSFEESAGLFDAPFPIEHRRRADGTLIVADAPRTGAPLLDQILGDLESNGAGFSLSGATFLPFDGPIDPSRLPSVDASIEPESPVFLVNIDPESPRVGQRIPLDLGWKGDAETLTPENVLVALPYQGFSLDPDTLYSVVVKRSLGDADGEPLSEAPAFRALREGAAPGGANGERATKDFAPLFTWLSANGEAPESIAGATVFRTGDPRVQIRRFRDHVASLPAPAAEELVTTDAYDEYCVVAGKVKLPVFQKGPKPYNTPGSGFVVTDAAGAPVVQETDDVDFVVTIPKQAMPAGGYPIVLYGNGGGGKTRQVIDRTEVAKDPDEGLGPPGQGPALHFARRGLSAFGFPAPLAWGRHPNGTGGELAFFNIENLEAFRGTITQAALDFVSLATFAGSIELPESACPGATSATGTFRFDPEKVYLYGHSTGSTVGGIVLAVEPRIRGGMLSGAGGTWILEVTMKKAPIALAPILGLLLDQDAEDPLDRHDLAPTLFQTMMDPVDVNLWARHIVREPLAGSEPKPLLVTAGIVDDYHLPRMIGSYAMAAGLDGVGPLVEPSLGEDLARAGRAVVSAPASAGGGAPGGFVFQREQREGVDGHYVTFEWDDVKYRYGCFFASMVAGEGGAVLPANDDTTAACAP
ncbi:MAG: hypothetical protein R3F14_32940, partial [Polyangiaceae bacterium]